MQSSYDNFVGIYDDAFSAAYCDALIEYFEWCKGHNMSFGRPEAERVKKDESVLLNPSSEQSIEFSSQNVEPYLKEFNFRFWEVCYKEYTERYSALLKYERHTVYSYKIQRTDPAGGYHIWHAEDGSKELSRRVGVYILYLNDVEEGGETEFLYLSKRIKPKKGRLLIFPPNYPWAHRGNPPLSGTKYILTGWTEFS